MLHEIAGKLQGVGHGGSFTAQYSPVRGQAQGMTLGYCAPGPKTLGLP